MGKTLEFLNLLWPHEVGPYLIDQSSRYGRFEIYRMTDADTPYFEVYGVVEA